MEEEEGNRREREERTSKGMRRKLCDSFRAVSLPS